MMRHIRVRWIHPPNEDPVSLYSELDEAGWEVRKVEVFDDGRMQYASAEASTGETALGQEPVPPLEEIAKDRQFEPVTITEEEFQSIWAESHLPRGQGMDEDQKCYHAIVWGPEPESVGRRITLHAKSGADAVKKLEAWFGEDRICTVWNDEDANKLR